MAEETTQDETTPETRVIRALVAVGGVNFSWQPGDEIELPAEQAALWADGQRAVYVDNQDEDATNPPPPAPSDDPGGDKPTGDPGGEKHVDPPAGSTVEESSPTTPTTADQVQEPSTSTEAPQSEGDGQGGGTDTQGDGSEPQGDGGATAPASADAGSITKAGGGWYEISIGDEVVDKVRGEEAAQARLAELQAATE